MKPPNAVRLRRAIELRERVPTLMLLPSMGKPLAPAFINAETSRFFDENAIPAPLRAVLEASSFNRSMMIGQHCFYRVNEIADENSEANAPCLREGFLVVGCGPSGDPLVVDLVSGDVGFVSHEELWGHPELQVRRDALAPTPFDLGTFYFAAALFAYNPDEPEAEAHDFPVDSYGAQKEGVTGWDDYKERVRAFERENARR